MPPLSRPARGLLTGRRFAAPVAFVGAAAAPPAAGGVVAQQSRVSTIVQTALAGKFSSDPGIRYGDGYFYLPTLAEVQQILVASQLDRRTWLAERFDCDDFAYVLKGEMSIHAYDSGDLRYGLCVGMVWGDFDWVAGYHAINWFIASDMVLRLIEPQSDTVYDVSHCLGRISLLLV
jgi:hypothetical protein